MQQPVIDYTGDFLEGGYRLRWPLTSSCDFIRLIPCPRPGLFRRFWIWFLLGAYWEKI